MKTYRLYYGGTFDPPHLGHHQIVKALVQDERVEKVHVVPTSVNPLKSGFPLLNQRQSLLESWFEDLQKELAEKEWQKIQLEDLEIKKGLEPSYTVETLRLLKAKYQSFDNWALAMGADHLRDLHLWKNVVQLAQEIHSVWMFPRGGELDLNLLHSDIRKLFQFRLMSQQVLNISATQVRSHLDALHLLQDCLTPQVKLCLHNMLL